jgi:hypothetical protein
VIAHEVLKDHADFLPEIERIELTNVDALDQDVALRGIVEAAQQFDHCGFSRAVVSHQSDLLARANM